MENEKKKLIEDIQKLINSYNGVKKTTINPNLLEFMNENDLKSIISELLDIKEKTVDSNLEWLEQFKKS